MRCEQLLKTRPREGGDVFCVDSASRADRYKLLERPVRIGLADEGFLVRSARKVRYPVPDRAWKRLLRRVVSDWGVVTKEEDIDRGLCGGPD